VSTGLRSGELAAAAGVNVQTLRYYERRGLLDEPDRTIGGHRMYPAETVTVLRVIKAAQRLGFTLGDVAELLEAGHHHSRRDRDGLPARAAAKLVEVEAALADLAVVRDTLRAALDAGCDDLMTCAESEYCPLPFVELGGGTPRSRKRPPVGDLPSRRDRCPIDPAVRPRRGR
jgi:MerR family transcriptional regulator, mercuric resistance operon regulatory protein